MAGVSIEFEFAEEDHEDSFVREYLAPSWETFERREEFDYGWFWQGGHHAEYDVDDHPAKPWVSLVVEGDPDEFLARERETWEQLRADGLLESWTVRRYAEEGYDSVLDQQRDVRGPVGGKRYVEMKVAVTTMSVQLLEAFDERLPVVGEPSEENVVPVNFWTLIHLMMLQNGYDWYDEMDACSKAIQNRCWSLADNRSPSHAREALRGTIDELQAFADELEEIDA